MDILIYGAGELGTQIQYLIAVYQKKRFNVLGFIDDWREKDTLVTENLRVLGSFNHVSSQKEYVPEKVTLIQAIGYNNMAARRDTFNHAKGLGYTFESFIHPKAIIEKNVTLGEGVIILAGAIIDQDVSIGGINFLDIGTTIGEKTVIASNNYFSAGTTVAGSVRVGESNFFGLNTTVVNNIAVGSNNFINARALIYKDLGDNKKVVEFYEQRIMRRQ